MTVKVTAFRAGTVFGIGSATARARIVFDGTGVLPSWLVKLDWQVDPVTLL